MPEPIQRKNIGSLPLTCPLSDIIRYDDRLGCCQTASACLLMAREMTSHTVQWFVESWRGSEDQINLKGAVF